MARGNAFRKDQVYKDKAEAKLKCGDTGKKALTNSPFAYYFEYGANGKGYWVYEHMVLQLEDCTDAHTVSYLEYDFLFLLDHSRGNDRQREDDLNIEQMNKAFGGNQPKMRETKIKEAKGCLGPYHTPDTLQSRDIQSMGFQPTDSGPFWI
jgi:hypothetical protein